MKKNITIRVLSKMYQITKNMSNDLRTKVKYFLKSRQNNVKIESKQYYNFRVKSESYFSPKLRRLEIWIRRSKNKSNRAEAYKKVKVSSYLLDRGRPEKAGEVGQCFPTWIRLQRDPVIPGYKVPLGAGASVSCLIRHSLIGVGNFQCRSLQNCCSVSAYNLQAKNSVLQCTRGENTVKIGHNIFLLSLFLMVQRIIYRF